jgi:hypothetical protein
MSVLFAQHSDNSCKLFVFRWRACDPHHAQHGSVRSPYCNTLDAVESVRPVEQTTVTLVWAGHDISTICDRPTSIGAARAAEASRHA